jgi:uncharacterized membrane protein
MDDLTRRMLGGAGNSEAPPQGLLAQIFVAVGWLNVVATVLIVAVTFSNAGKIGLVPVALVALGSGGLATLILFGIAQVLNSITKIEYNTNREKNDALLQSLHRIEKHLETMAEKK